MMILTARQKLAWSLYRAALATLASLMVACGGNYYQITDVDSGKSYYTRDIDRDDGHAEFTDKVTGDKVSLDKFEIRTVTAQQYKNAVHR